MLCYFDELVYMSKCMLNIAASWNGSLGIFRNYFVMQIPLFWQV